MSNYTAEINKFTAYYNKTVLVSVANFHIHDNDTGVFIQLIHLNCINN